MVVLKIKLKLLVTLKEFEILLKAKFEQYLNNINEGQINFLCFLK